MKTKQAEILKEIKKSGFPAELQISNIFKEDDWNIQYNNYYIDHDELKGREIDLVCSYTKTTTATEDEYLELGLNLVVEIKSSKNPWIFFSNSPTTTEVITNPPFIANYINFSKNPQHYFTCTICKLAERLGRSVYQANSSGKDPIYSALCGVIKATEHMYESHFLQEDNADIPKLYGLLYYYEPVIIFDGEMFESYLGIDGEIEVQESKYMQVSFNYLSPHYKSRKNGYLVHVVRASHLKDFLAERKECFSKVSEIILKSEKPQLTFL
ncbi:hypothetical protein KJ742_04945 [Patescibacteria group bacterium]|nr:hypothetical protein [Patescibacteria group bacterium]MBU1683266.1 hypothetical protein [Patescibacteria group bacterium]